MASPAIGRLASSRARLRLRRFMWRPGRGLPDRARGPANPALSFGARQAALWSRMTLPLRPLESPRARATERETSWPLRREPASVRRARHLAVAQLGLWGLREPPDLEETVVLLVSELVTNSVRHTRGPLRLNLRVRDGRLCCEVEDTNSDGPAGDPAGDPAGRAAGHGGDSWAEGGRGIGILDALADAWGSFRTATGKTTWFEVEANAPAVA
ncbi:ATP-binding protein [Streptomyces spongiicola]|nr:ATP-binding protein [Streptomyces spongiicola]